jgi:hypothetical protein
VTSQLSSDPRLIDLERDLPTTPEDIEVLRRLHSESLSWFSLSPDDVDALLPEGALDRRPATSGDAEPFTLP